MSTSRLQVVVAMVTYRRPKDVAEVIPMLIREATAVSEAVGSQYDVGVVVVDNDPQHSALDPATRAANPRLRYVAEPEPGIAAARNRALDEAANSDVLVFIDDDERPSEDWLANLLQTYARTGAGAVAGPVSSRFDVVPEPWIEAGGFFARRHRAGLVTGSLITNAATNNLLLDLAVVRSQTLRFDPSFGLSGGSDTLFTRSFARRGGRMVWCAEAVVVEIVPASRLRRRWLLTRALSYGSIDTRVEVALATGRAARIAARTRCLGRGLPRVTVGAGRVVTGAAFRSDRHVAIGLQTMLRGCGLVAGAFGYTFGRYRRPAVQALSGGVGDTGSSRRARCANARARHSGSGGRSR